MDAREILIDGIERTQETLSAALDGLTAAQANTPIAPGTNPISWLVWHAARQEDAQVAHLAGTQEVWVEEGWADRFGLDLPRDSMGYGHTPADVAKVVVSDLELLRGYVDAATDATVAYLRRLDLASLDEVIDRNWDPPVTRGVRLVSIIDDAAQHGGQAAYARGIVDRGHGS